jgi:AraC-like DNA-binding protein
MMVNDKVYFEEKLTAEALVFHFNTDVLGDVFFSIPEMTKIYQLIERAKVGLLIKGNKRKIIARMDQLYEKEGFDRLISFLELLHIIAKTENVSPLSSTLFLDSFDKGSNSKLNKAYEFIFKNFNTEISLGLIADHVHMNASAFSRFFKKATNKSFIFYLNELRVGYACKKLLEDQELTISQVCYESGFNNLSNFNKQFKTITGKNPKEYVMRHLDSTTKA